MTYTFLFSFEKLAPLSNVRTCCGPPVKKFAMSENTLHFTFHLHYLKVFFLEYFFLRKKRRFDLVVFAQTELKVRFVYSIRSDSQSG